MWAAKPSGVWWIFSLRYFSLMCFQWKGSKMYNQEKKVRREGGAAKFPSKITRGKFSVFPLRQPQPLLLFWCKQLQVPQVSQFYLSAMSSMFTCSTGLSILSGCQSNGPPGTAADSQICNAESFFWKKGLKRLIHSSKDKHTSCYSF